MDVEATSIASCSPADSGISIGGEHAAFVDDDECRWIAGPDHESLQGAADNQRDDAAGAAPQPTGLNCIRIGFNGERFQLRPVAQCGICSEMILVRNTEDVLAHIQLMHSEVLGQLLLSTINQVRSRLQV